MPETANFRIEQGRTGAIDVTVTGVVDWSGLTAKLFATDKYGNAPVMSLTGSIDTGNDVITFPYTHNDTKDLEAMARYYFEVVVYKSDKADVKTTTMGLITVDPVIVIDPTV